MQCIVSSQGQLVACMQSRNECITTDADATSETAKFQFKEGTMTYPSLKLLALIVDLPKAGEMGFGLVFEESVVKHLVVNVQLTHLGLHAIPLLLLQFLVLLFLL